MIVDPVLLVFNVLVASGQRSKQWQKRTDGQLIWEYDVRKSDRIGGYQVRATQFLRRENLY